MGSTFVVCFYDLCIAVYRSHFFITRSVSLETLFFPLLTVTNCQNSHKPCDSFLLEVPGYLCLQQVLQLLSPTNVVADNKGRGFISTLLSANLWNCPCILREKHRAPALNTNFSCSCQKTPCMIQIQAP